jgi:transcriptional regulator with XRE-family HTH domain
MAGRKIDAVDVHVGRNIRIFRNDRGMSQTELADKIGVTFQQVQKYESGMNRVGSGRLFKIAKIFNLPIGALFEGANQPVDVQSGISPTAMLAEPYALRLLRAFNALEDATLRKSIAELVESLPATSKSLVNRASKRR